MKKIIVLLAIFIVTSDFSYSQFTIQRTQLNGNNINSYFQNTGIFDQNTISGNNAGFEWPKGSGKYAIFTTGLTIAGYYNNQLRMASCSYKGEYYSGYCISGVPYRNSNFHIYKVSRGDNQNTNPDWANWGLMVPYGAPFVDVNNNGTYEPAIDTPGVRSAMQTIFMCLTDGFDSCHNLIEGFGGGTPCLFAEMHMTAWCYNKMSLQDVQFIKMVIINKANYTWDSSIFSVVCDPDLGYANDDYIGCDTTRKLGYCYNANNNDPQYGAAPPAVGILLLKGAFNKYVIPNKYIGISSFDCFSNPSTSPPPCEIDPNPDPVGAYFYMSGFKRDSTCWLDPTQLVLPPNYFKKTKYIWPGDPETQNGWTELKGAVQNCGGDSSGTPVIPNPYGDRRFVMSSGKVKVNPGDTQIIIISQLIAKGTNNLNSVTKLKALADSVIALYNNGFTIGIKPISSEIPAHFQLYQNYPNPFNPTTKIKFDIPPLAKGWRGEPLGSTGGVSLKIYDITGREIQSLVNEQLSPGTYEVTFRADDFSAGIYFYKLQSERFSESKKMVLIK